MTSHTALTATIFLPMQCRLVCGREDGSIIMVPATQTIMLNLLTGKHQNLTNWPQHQVCFSHNVDQAHSTTTLAKLELTDDQVYQLEPTSLQLLLGHAGRVNCLLYPNNEHPRYDVAHLVSGSVDFSVCLWWSIFRIKEVMSSNVKKWVIPGLFLFIFNTIDSKQVNKCSIWILPMTGFELRNSGIGSDHSTKWATPLPLSSNV